MKRTISTIYLLLITTVIVVFSTVKSEAHFGSKGPFGGSVSCAIVKDSVVYIGTNTGGVYESTNPQLIAWRPRPVGLKSGKINALTHTGSYLFAATDSGVYRFTGFIGNDRYWENTNTGLSNLTITSLCAIDSITVLAGTTGFGVYKTINKGATWDSSNTNMLHYDINGFAMAGSRIIQISDGGLWASDDSAQTWFDFTDISTDDIDATAISYNSLTNEILVYNTVGLYTLSSASTTLAPVYVSAQANLPSGAIVRSISNNGSKWYLATSQGVYTSPTGTISWTSENAGITTQDVNAIISFPNQNKIVAGTTGEGIFKTPDSLISWTVMNAGFNNLVTYSLICKDTLLVVAATEKGVFVSKDLATSYSRANNGLTDSLHVNDLNFFGNLLIAGTQNAGVFISADTGLTWTAFNINLTNMDIRKVRSSASYVYLINSAGEIYQSDLVLGWTLIQTGLPGVVTPTSMAFYPGNILLGTWGDGVYMRPEVSGSWMQMNTGLTNLNVTSVTYNDQNKIFAGTDGNGVFAADPAAFNWTATAPLTIPFTTTMGLDGSKILDMAYYAGYTFASFRGSVLATSDNGTTWIEAGTQFNVPSYADLNKLSFVTTRLFTTTPNNSLYSQGLSELPVLAGISDININTNLLVYPNPVKNNFQLTFNNPSEKLLRVELFNVKGELVKQFENLNRRTFFFDVKGVYILRAVTNLAEYNSKLVVE